ncbi:MAG: hypothetical protein ABIB93_03805 [Chloroflexota bacterium]
MERAGEVIEATATGFIAQCYELYHIPPLGSLVKTGDPPIYAVVCDATTSSIEPGRRPLARGYDEPDEESVYRASPQLSRLLRSVFSTLAVGFLEGDHRHHYLPPYPAAIHGFVYPCSNQEIKDFSSSFDFLNLLINSHLSVDAGELTASALRQMSQAHDNPHGFLVSAGKELTALLRGDYNLLRAILMRLKNE